MFRRSCWHLPICKLKLTGLKSSTTSYQPAKVQIRAQEDFEASFIECHIVLVTNCPNRACIKSHLRRHCPASWIGKTSRSPPDLLTSLNHRSYININHHSCQSRTLIPSWSSEQKLTQTVQVKHRTLTMPPTPE